MAAEPVAQPALASEPTDASVIADARQRMEHLEWHALMLQQRQQLLLVQHQMLLDAAAALHDSMQEQDHGCNGGNGGNSDTEHAATTTALPGERRVCMPRVEPGSSVPSGRMRSMSSMSPQ